MANRRSLGDAVTMSPEKLAFIHGNAAKEPAPAKPSVPPGDNKAALDPEEEAPVQETKPPAARRRSRGRLGSPPLDSNQLLDQMLVPVTIRLRRRTAQALKRACLQQELAGAKPDTQQDIGEEALSVWLSENDYL
jgi:hypothetical protein